MQLVAHRSNGSPSDGLPKPGLHRIARATVRFLEWPVVHAIVVAAAAIGAWQVLVLATHPTPIELPSPKVVEAALRDLVQHGFSNTSLATHIGMSLMRVAAGTAAALLVGVPTGFAMARSSVVRRLLTPFITLFRPVPPFAMLAVLVVWFGISETSKILLIYAAAVTIVALTTMDGVQRLPAEYREAAAMLGADRWQTFLHVVVPGTLPEILSGTRVALAIAWTSLIAAEWVGGRTGVGTIILQSAEFIRTDQTVAGIIILAVMGGLTDRLMALLQRGVTGWATR